MKRLASSLLFATASLGLFARCQTVPDVPEGTSGPDMYDMLLCADCHGPSGEGTVKGPPLRDLEEHWILERNLADYLRDPEPFQLRDPRINWLHNNYEWNKPRYYKLTFEQRMSFAAWLFTLD